MMRLPPVKQEDLSGVNITSEMAPDGGARIVLDVSPEALLRTGLAQESRSGLADAFAAKFVHTYASKLNATFVSYRDALIRKPSDIQNRQLQEAFERARLQAQILSDVPMADAREVCELLGLSTANPAQTVKRRADELLRFEIEGRPRFPLAQFDLENHRVYPAFIDILAMARGRGWGNFRLLNWLLRPHLDFDGAPADALPLNPEAVREAFRLDVEPEHHG